MNLNKLAVGKTVGRAMYLDNDLILFHFTDGSTLSIRQTQQAGELDVCFNQAIEVKADDDEGEQDES